MPKMKKQWPVDCIWPAPIDPERGGFDFDENLVDDRVDDEIEDLLEIKEYFDGLVQEGRLNEDYTLNEDYCVGDTEEDANAWQPEKGIDYWDEQFNVECWREDLSAHMNLLKITDFRPGKTYVDDPVVAIQEIIGYRFVNENLLRQAFTRRSFAVEYGLKGGLRRDGSLWNAGSSEELEFFGDAVLNSIVSKEILRQFTEVNPINTEAPFCSPYNEGDFTRIRAHFVSREYLSERAAALGLDRFILYGSGEEAADAAREDMMEALIGAVAVDSGWDSRTLEELIDRLVDFQLDCPDRLLKKSYYDSFNSWHQRNFGVMPEYELYRVHGEYGCSIRFFVPENDKGIRVCQRIEAQADTRSRARNRAAQYAHDFVHRQGLWVNLKDSGIEPDRKNSINQLQELYQKKYIEEAPVYEFEERDGDIWECSCACEGIYASGRAGSKTAAKKEAAYRMLVMLFCAAGIQKDEWTKELWASMID